MSEPVFVEATAAAAPVDTGRRPIRRLPPSLVNRIAAGEVIERPASVVKELVENAIDAGATAIDVEVEDGGLGLIRVIDNGCGIPPDELKLAVAEHATSKLTDDEDLFRIQTKGFRGEALASIASVSHLRLTSRTAGSDAAWSVDSRGGDVGVPQACAGNPGTTVEVRHLFFNTPARRKFMKGPGTEYGHIAEMLLRLALPHPEIAFSLAHNARVNVRLPCSNLRDRLLQAWPEDFRERGLDLDAAESEIRLQGLIGLPELAHPTGRHQYLYVNRRPIRDKFIAHALKESFRGLTEPGRHPAAVLLLFLPPADVDVNVHPTKSEVRFRNSSRVHGLVMTAVREVLLGADLSPHAAPRRVVGSDHTATSDLPPSSNGPEGASSSPPAGAAESETQRRDLMQTLADFFRLQPSSPFLLDPPARATAAESTPATPPETSPPPPAPPVQDPTVPAGHADPSAARRLPPTADALSRQALPGGIASDEPAPHRRPPEPETIPPVTPRAVLPVQVLHLHNTYLVLATADGLQIIDQHALHERILYEELLGRLRRGNLGGQQLLIPPVLRVTDRQIDLLESLRPLLGQLGMELMPARPGQLAVTAFPGFLSRLDPADFVRDLLERAEAGGFDLHAEALLGGVLEMMACKAAVKAGDPLTPEQIDTLLARRDAIERASNCPHGRPTTLKLTLRDLEKQFKRTGF